ncbi:2Fe-2S iron-sulfur cluster binding domain-containing protein [Janibacter sp. GXQ6167]|uniref:2Fe-2S iron-sulfur cluster binding domain-containing protein n=1 Tax=Janibacter sp. GXQ6167 TaxID=3240791 RepID=UPI0035240DB7
MADASTLTLTTTDGVVTTVSCPPGQTVIDAAAAESVILPSLCGQGACGACLATVTEGSYTSLPSSPDAMGPMAGEGAALLCCTVPTEDLRIDLPYDQSRIVSSAPAKRTATITALESVGHDVVCLVLALDADDTHGSAAEFDPGQFVQLQVPGREDLRAYSLANVGNWDGELEFYIHVLPKGVFSDYLRDRASVGDTLTVIGPQGAFGLRENGLRPRWFIGGGTGLAPLLSMMRRMAEWGDPQPVRAYFGVTTEDDLFGIDQIAEVCAMLAESSVTIAIWRPKSDLANLAVPDGVQVVSGSVADAMAEELAGLGQRPDIYVCGPPGMVQALEYVLAEHGVDPQFVVTERFTEN